MPNDKPSFSIKNAMPLISTVIGAALVLAIAGRCLLNLSTWTERLFVVITLGFYLCWMKWESRISLAELAKDTQDHDFHTMELAAVAKITTLVLAFWFTETVNLGVAALGLLVMAWGIKLRTDGIKALAHHYSHRIRIPDCIVERGAYARLRHPSYAGTFILHVGFVMVLANPYAVASLILLWGGVVLVRTLLEERVLQQLDTYRAYSQRVPFRLIRGIW